MPTHQKPEWLTPLAADDLRELLRDAVGPRNGIHLRELHRWLIREGVKPPRLTHIGEKLESLGIPWREQLKVEGVNAAGIHWSAVFASPEERADYSPARTSEGLPEVDPDADPQVCVPRWRKEQRAPRCVGVDGGQRCPIAAEIREPVPLCGYHRWKVATDLDPTVRDRLPAPAHPALLPDLARPVRFQQPGKHSSVVYFLVNGNRVKIGKSTNLQNRLTSLALPRTSLILTLRGGHALEGALHRRFDDLRVNGSEWFRLEPPLEEYISRKAEELEAVAVSSPGALPSESAGTGPDGAPDTGQGGRYAPPVRVREMRPPFRPAPHP